MVDIKCISATALSDQQLRAWQGIRTSRSCFDSAYFSPKFTLAVAAVRPDVRVAVFSENGKDVGFFPFHKRLIGSALPVGLLLSDLHGPIVETDLAWDWKQLLSACHVSGFEYGHLIDSQVPKVNSANKACSSPFIELHQGFDAYIEQRRAGTNAIVQTERKSRKASREVGPVRLVYESSDPKVWEALLQWKAGQYRRTDATNPFLHEWAAGLLQGLSKASGPDLMGIVSALYFGDRLVAVHFGMLGGRVLHWWFPAYDTSLSKYSPGLILLLETIKAAAAHGVERIDLGKGEEPYKLRFMTGKQTLYEGSVDANAVLHQLRVSHARIRRWLFSTRVGRIAKSAVKRMRIAAR